MRLKKISYQNTRNQVVPGSSRKLSGRWAHHLKPPHFGVAFFVSLGGYLLSCFKMPFVYILHSQTADKFYIGATSIGPEQRLKLHQDLYYGNKKFTSKYKDWVLFYTIECSSFSQARKIENHIKKMKQAMPEISKNTQGNDLIL